MNGKGAKWEICTLHLNNYRVEDGHASSSQIRRSWNPVPCEGIGGHSGNIHFEIRRAGTESFAGAG
jgi:hypothetical protein